jgi:hypothetical protein
VGLRSSLDGQGVVNSSNHPGIESLRRNYSSGQVLSKLLDLLKPTQVPFMKYFIRFSKSKQL